MIRERRSGRPQTLAAILLLCAPLPAAGADAMGTPRLAKAVPAATALVEEVRGIRFREKVAWALLPEKELPELLGRKLVEDLPTSFETYAATLASLGLIENEPDLLSRITKLYARQVVGFYDPDAKRFFLVPERSGQAAAGAQDLAEGASELLEEALLTHELTHALQDQRLGLAKRIRWLREDSDALLALEAFLEGEATVVMTEGILRRLPEDQRALFSSDSMTSMLSGLAAAEGTAGVEGSEGVPAFFVKELVFPYVAGTAFVQARRKSGGWPAVDALYARLPSSTAEVLHPEKAPVRCPIPGKERPGRPDVPSDAKFLYADSLGEWIIRTLLEPAGADGAAAAAAGRCDDRIAFFERPGGGIGFLWRIRAVDGAAAARLARALEARWADRPPPTRPRIEAKGDLVTAFTPGLIGPKAASAPAEGR